MKRLLRYFLNGFLILAPISITVYIILSITNWLDQLFDLGIPGLGILVMVMLFTLVGFISSSFLVKPFLVISERLLTRLPLVSIIYTSIKDLFNAFVGDNQKFNKPVLVKMNNFPETFRMGFVTHDNLMTLLPEEKVAIYFPDSYNFSGELWLVHRENLTYLELPSSDVMKFIVSGGVAKL